MRPGTLGNRKARIIGNASIQPKCCWSVKSVWAETIADWRFPIDVGLRVIRWIGCGHEIQLLSLMQDRTHAYDALGSNHLSDGAHLGYIAFVLFQTIVISLGFRVGTLVAQRLLPFKLQEDPNTMRSTNPTRHSRTKTTRTLAYLLGSAALVLSSFVTVFAQQSDALTPPKVEAKLIIGGASFAEPSIPHSIVGGAVRVYLTRRFSVEPEFLYMRHDRHDQDYFIQLNAAYDITDPTKKFVVYGIAGVGNLRNRSDFGGNGIDTSFTTWTGSIGGGVKIFLTKRLFVAPEVRVGREPDVRGTVSLGYVFAGRK